MKANVHCWVLSAILFSGTSVVLADDTAVPVIFANRFGQAREGCLMRHRSVAADRSVVAALRWFKANQKPDGNWGDRNPVAMTSLATLALLGHGETLESPEFGLTLNKAFQYLLGKGPQAMMYEHAIMTCALAEGYGITRFPGLKAPLQEAVDVLVISQKTQKADPLHAGGWRYSRSSVDSDTSVTGWCVQALKAAKAAGADVPDATLENASQYLWKTYSNGSFGYDRATPTYRPSTTAIGVFSQALLDHGGDPRLKPSFDKLKTTKFDWNKETGWPLYTWYYMTHAHFQGGGQQWDQWNNAFRDNLVRHQAADGHWDIPPASKETYGPTYSTALCALMLEVYYRFPAAPAKTSALPAMRPLR